EGMSTEMCRGISKNNGKTINNGPGTHSNGFGAIIENQETGIRMIPAMSDNQMYWFMLTSNQI
ncbi:MAG TPA: hypothetical protein PLB32_16460, partial [Acidobacteriota bacterium]|nr:hypothetical protein [Acidobacteriota bacterium]